MYLNNVAKDLKFKSSASRMNTDSTNRLKNLIDLKNQSSSKNFNRLEYLTFSHPNDDHGAMPSPDEKNHKYEWLLKTTSLTSPIFCCSLNKNLVNTNKFVPILQLLNEF